MSVHQKGISMRINADFHRSATITPSEYQWVASPSAGVERMMLDRVGEEVARATSLVRYAPNSTFGHHDHGGGEEILVLEGVFADEHGEYPAGSYLRNPIGTGHTPRIGDEGALIFVKLHQFDPKDTLQLNLPAHRFPWQPDRQRGVIYKTLHNFEHEKVAIEYWEPDTTCTQPGDQGGIELLVLEGSMQHEGRQYPVGSWLRFPHAGVPALTAGTKGAKLYVKRGHLPTSTVDNAPERSFKNASSQ